MTKNSRYMLLIAVLVAYTFTLGVMKQSFESFTTLTFVSLAITLIVLVFCTVLSTNIQLRFGIKFVEKGKKHKEDLVNSVSFYSPMVVLAVFLYTIDILSGYPLILMYVIIGVITVYLFLSVMFDYVIITEDGFKGGYLIQPKEQEIKFTEIEKVEFSTLMNNLVLSGNNKKVYLDVALIDAQLFINELTSKVDERLYKEAMEKLKKYYTSFMVKSNFEVIDYFKGDIEINEG